MSLNIELLEQSFARIKPRADEFAASLYEKLFIAHPELKPLFANTDMAKQKKKLLSSLVLVVENLRNPEALGGVLNALGARHVAYGAIAKYYPAVGEALLTTFEQYLQQDWTPEVKQAWVDAFQAITALMLKGAGAEYEPEEVQLNTEIPEKQVADAPATLAKHKVESVPDSESSELPVELLERSFAQIKPRADEFATSLYEKLFIAHPELKPLFANTDMAKQKKKLLSSLVLVVENLRNPEALGGVLNALGARHVAYGAIAKYYPAVGEALLKTFEQYLQQDWTPEVKQAWVKAYRAITALMVKGASEASSPKGIPAEKAATIEKPRAGAQSDPIESASRPFSLSEFNAEIKEKFKLFLKVQQWGAVLKQVPAKIIDTFWILPTWGVAIIATVLMIAVFLFTDEDSWVGKLLGGADTISLVVAIVLFIKEAPDRRKQFHYQAWSTIDASHDVKVSYARILALQDLNEDGVSLRGLDSPGAELAKINLPNANLSEAKLNETDLSNANLSHANLNNTILTQAKLYGANLSHADASFAKLTQANLSSANLSNANLLCAELSGANMSGANLSNATLSGANLDGTYLAGANLKNAKVSISELSAAVIEGAIMPDGSKYKSVKGSN